MKILLVEDHVETRSLLVARWSPRLDVVTADDGAEALKAVAESMKSRVFDAMVVDVAMLYVDGLGFVRAMRCLEINNVYPYTRILMHTAHGDLIQNSEALVKVQIPPNDVFLKPLGADPLTQRLMDMSTARINIEA